VTKAVNFLSSSSPLPPSDRFEPNDSVSQAHTLWGARQAFDATLDYWDDPVDVYRVRLQPGERLRARVSAGWANASVGLTLWRPGTKSLHGRKGLVASTAHPGQRQRLSYRASSGGWYDLALRTVHLNGGRYSLQVTKS
jgi:hypothetical protein